MNLKKKNIERNLEQLNSKAEEKSNMMPENIEKQKDFKLKDFSHKFKSRFKDIDEENFHQVMGKLRGFIGEISGDDELNSHPGLKEMINTLDQDESTLYQGMKAGIKGWLKNRK